MSITEYSFILDPSNGYCVLCEGCTTVMIVWRHVVSHYVYYLLKSEARKTTSDARW